MTENDLTSMRSVFLVSCRSALSARTRLSPAENAASPILPIDTPSSATRSSAHRCCSTNWSLGRRNRFRCRRRQTVRSPALMAPRRLIQPTIPVIKMKKATLVSGTVGIRTCLRLSHKYLIAKGGSLDYIVGISAHGGTNVCYIDGA